MKKESPIAGRSTKYVLWCLSDGKPGHENQVRGLVQALADQCALDTHGIRVKSGARPRWNWLRGKFPEGKNLPPPHLILGAGHSTHLAMLAARHAHGGKAIVLMKPSWGRSRFDLCLIPAHDGLNSRSNILLTQGVLNTIRPASAKEMVGPQEDQRGLFLIGGPSKHHAWEDDEILRQVEAIVDRSPEVSWSLTTSRRTPTPFVHMLRASAIANLKIVPYEETPTDWVPRQLAATRVVWVSEDSVSMVYEALTAGGRVGLLELPRLRQDRVTRGVQELVDQRQLTSFRAWEESGEMVLPARNINEAERCAAIIHDSWLRAQAA